MCWVQQGLASTLLPRCPTLRCLTPRCLTSSLPYPLTAGPLPACPPHCLSPSLHAHPPPHHCSASKVELSEALEFVNKGLEERFAAVIKQWEEDVKRAEQEREAERKRKCAEAESVFFGEIPQVDIPSAVRLAVAVLPYALPWQCCRTPCRGSGAVRLAVAVLLYALPWQWCRTPCRGSGAVRLAVVLRVMSG